MTENELKEHSGNACEFTHSLCVVSLDYALAAIKTEREACAAECERMMMFPGGRQESFAHHGVEAAAKAIRERSNV